MLYLKVLEAYLQDKRISYEIISKGQIIDDTILRNVYVVILHRNKKIAMIEYMSPIVNKEPTILEVFDRIQKEPIPTFNEFLNNYNFIEANTALEIYQKKINEYEALLKIFTDKELEEINKVLN